MKKVVSATLAGALAVGMVPAVALADEVELLMSEADAIAGGEIILKAGQADGQSFAHGSKGYLLPVKVKPQDVTVESGYKAVTKLSLLEVSSYAAGGTKKDWLDNGVNIYCGAWADYNVNADGTLGSKTDGTLDIENLPVGTYAVGAWVGGTWVKEVVTFTVTGGDATGLEFFDNSNGTGSKYDIEDEVVTFNNTKYALAAGTGLGLKAGGEDVTGAFTLGSVKDANGMIVDADDALKYAGTYNVQVIGNADGKFKGVDTYLPVTINPIDVSKLTVTLGAVSSNSAASNGKPAIVAVNGDANSPLKSMLTVKGMPLSYAAPGTYDATVGVNASAFSPAHNESTEAAAYAAEKALFDASIYGTAPATFTVATQTDVAIDVYYGTDLMTNGASKTIDYSVAGTTDFNPAAISVKYTALGASAQTVAADADEVITYAKSTADGMVPCAAEDLKTPGTYQVTVTLKSTADQAFEVESYTYKVTKGDLGDANISVTQDGAGVYTKNLTGVYDGTDLMDGVSIVLRDSKGAVIDPAYYTVEIKNTLDSKGQAVAADKQAVTEVVDAGTYTVTIKSDYYGLAANEYTFTVSPEDVNAWVADFAEDGDRAKGTVLYTGEAIDPVTHFTVYGDFDGDKQKEYAVTEFAVGESDYKVTIEKFRPEGAKVDAAKNPAEVREAGTYTIKVADVAGGNVDVDEAHKLTLVVTTKPVFVDVEAGKFYTEAVHSLASKGIMGGYGNGLFGVADSTERQDVALTMLRLLDRSERLNYYGDNEGESGDNQSDQHPSFILPFSDTDVNAYYAYAVWYCNKNKIMTGHKGTTLFGVGEDVTREQVATILFRIDESGLYGAEDTLLKASALDAYEDADEISGYAVEAMEWAVENGIFGVNTDYLTPGDAISRAEFATVIDRYMELREME